MKNLNEASFSPKTVLILMRFTIHCGQLNDFKYRLQLLFRMLAVSYFNQYNDCEIQQLALE